MLRYAGCAVRLKVGPVMPGAAAYATGARNSVAAATSTRNSCVLNFAFFIFIGLIAALLIAGVSNARVPNVSLWVAGVSKRAAGGVRVLRGWVWYRATHGRADIDLGHHSAEVFCIVGQVVELGSVEVERAARRIERGRTAGARIATATGVAGI